MTEHDDPLWDPQLPADAELARMQRLLARYRLDTAAASRWASPVAEVPVVPRTRPRWRWGLAAAMLLLAIVPAMLWQRLQWPADAPWPVFAGDGGRLGTLAVGQTLDSGDSTRGLAVARIGSLRLAPGSRLGLDETRRGRHRVALLEGRLHARIWAPPGWFVVDMDGSEVVDLGCEFELERHRDGSGEVRVLSGWILHSAGAVDVLVPQHYTLRFTAGQADTPLHHAATPALRSAVQAMDRRHQQGLAADPRLAQAVADAATDADAYSLLALLTREPALAAGPLYPRLAQALGQDAGDAQHRAAWTAGSVHAINAWWDVLPRPPKQWWRYWRDALPW